MGHDIRGRSAASNPHRIGLERALTCNQADVPRDSLARGQGPEAEEGCLDDVSEEPGKDHLFTGREMPGMGLCF